MLAFTRCLPRCASISITFSPYSYLAWHRIRKLEKRPDVQLEAVPILFAALLNHHGTLGPAEVPAKRSYVFADCMRKASQLGIQLRPPPKHPFNPLLALRVSGLDMPEDKRRKLITRLFDATWGEGLGVTDSAVVDRIAAELGLVDASQRAAKPETKANLKTRTSEAIDAGAFGVPTMLCQGQLFWASTASNTWKIC